MSLLSYCAKNVTGKIKGNLKSKTSSLPPGKSEEISELWQGLCEEKALVIKTMEEGKQYFLLSLKKM